MQTQDIQRLTKPIIVNPQYTDTVIKNSISRKYLLPHSNLDLNQSHDSPSLFKMSNPYSKGILVKHGHL